MIMLLSPNGNKKISFWRCKDVAGIQGYHPSEKIFYRYPHSGIQKAHKAANTFAVAELAASYYYNELIVI